MVREKKGSVKISELDAITGILTETLLVSPISTNRRTHWDHLKYYPCSCPHTVALRAFFCLFPSLSHSSVRILFSLTHFARLASGKPSYRKIISLLSVPWAHCVNFTRRLRVVNFPCTDWFSYLRTQLKAFVGGVCLRSRKFFLALFSRINFFTWSRHFKGGEVGEGGSEPPASRTLLSRFPYLYLPPPALFRAAPVPCKLAESKHILVI